MKKRIITVQCPTAEEMIRELKTPSPTTMRRLEEKIDAESAQIAADLEHDRAEKVERLRACQEQREAALNRESEELDMARSKERAAESGHPSLWLTSLYWACGVIAVASEFILNQGGLVALLNLRPGSFSAVTAALAPTAGVIIIEELIHRLIESPWRSAMGRGGRPIWAIVHMIAFLTALGVANFVTIGLLGEARAEAFNLQTSIVAGGDLPQVDLQLQRVTVIAISLILAFNAAYFLLLARLEGARFWRLVKAWVTTRRRTRAVQRCRDDLWEIRKELRGSISTSEAPAMTSVVRQHRANLHFQLSQRLAEIRLRERDYVQLVEDALALHSPLEIPERISRITRTSTTEGES